MKTSVGEGFYDPIGVGKPGSFIAAVGGASRVSGFRGLGWQGHVVEGHEAYIGMRVVLKRKLACEDEEGRRFPEHFGIGLGVVAYIYDTARKIGGKQIFSGICVAEVVEKVR